MLIKPDCISCILTMSLSAIRKLSLNETEVKDLHTDILKIPALRGLNWNITSAEIIEDVWEIIVK